MKDELKLKEYRINEGAKLMLTRVKPANLRQLLLQHFQNSFDSTTAGNLADLFIANMKKRVSAGWSLDDIEHLSATYQLK
jgi:hypothetical protein